MIKAFKFRAQAIFILLEKTHPLVHKICVRENFFIILPYYSYHYSTLFYLKSYIHKKLDTNSCFTKLRAISYLFSFFLYTLYNLIIWQAFVLMNRAIWLAADQAGFSCISHGQNTIFIALRHRVNKYKGETRGKSCPHFFNAHARPWQLSCTFFIKKKIGKCKILAVKRRF